MGDVVAEDMEGLPLVAGDQCMLGGSKYHPESVGRVVTVLGPEDCPICISIGATVLCEDDDGELHSAHPECLRKLVKKDGDEPSSHSFEEIMHSIKR